MKNVLSVPWKWGCCTETPEIKYTFKILCSIINHSVFDWLYKFAKLIQGNDVHLDGKNKTKPIAIMQLDESLKMKRWVPRRPLEMPPNFQDIIDREHFKLFLDTNKDAFWGLWNNMAESFYDKIYSEDG